MFTQEVPLPFIFQTIALILVFTVLGIVLVKLKEKMKLKEELDNDAV